MGRSDITVAGLLFAAACLLTVQGKLMSPLPPSTFDKTQQLETKGFYNILNSPRADDNTADNYRLPNNTVPVHYNVELTTNVHSGNRAFTGIVKIDLTVLLDTRTIVLHTRQLSNYVATIMSTDSATAPNIALTTEYEATREFLSLTPTDSSVNFAQGTNWQLTITYSGELRTDNGGFYLSSYTDDANTVHYLATTQFESTNARHAFPCYDEPALRATFDIAIKHDPSYIAISNMPVNTAKSSSGFTAFDTTLKMSTYLVAFIVSDFEYTEGELNGVKQRTYTRKGTKDQQEWALVSGLLIESSLAGYFGVPFALPKLDQAGIPDFAAGAMENWGLATYREQYMLWTKEKNTINAKTNVASIIGHEDAHMWFGDLVSIKWWTYLWLKEGFATIFSYESNDIAFPEWNVYQMFHVGDYNSALINDATTDATPMTHYVQTPSEISGRYNTFSYAKPGSVLYMFKNAWTDPVFRLGLNKYLTKNKFNSCDEWDLFAALQEAADELKFQLPEKIDKIFSSWSKQGGFPLLTVERNYNGGSFTVKQQQYTNDKNYNNTKTWYVPINYAVASNPDFRDTRASHYLLDVAELSVSNAGLANDDWLLLNKQSTGYYRILYDERNYELIAEGLSAETHKFHPRNRAQLMHDAYRFVATERLSHSTLLHLMAYLGNEDQYAPWSVANGIFSIYDQYLRGDGEYNNFRNFVIELVDDIFNKLGVNEVPGEHYLNNYLRVVIISLACQVGSEKCYEQTNNKLKQYLNSGIIIEPTLKAQIYCAGLRKSEDAVYNRVYDLLFASTITSDRSFYINALGCSQTASQIKKFIESSIETSNNLASSERTSLLNSAYSRGEVGLTASLEFLESNWQAYGNLGTGTAKPLDTALRGMASYVVSEKQKTRLNALVQTVSGSDLVNDNLNTRVDANVQANFDWLAVNRNPLLTWISAYQKGNDNGSATLTASMTSILATIALLLCKLL